MLGRPEMQCRPSTNNPAHDSLYNRCIFQDMKVAIDFLKEFNDKLNSLHPDVIYKIRSLF